MAKCMARRSFRENGRGCDVLRRVPGCICLHLGKVKGCACIFPRRCEKRFQNGSLKCSKILSIFEYEDFFLANLGLKKIEFVFIWRSFEGFFQDDGISFSNLDKTFEF